MDEAEFDTIYALDSIAMALSPETSDEVCLERAEEVTASTPALVLADVRQKTPSLSHRRKRGNKTTRDYGLRLFFKDVAQIPIIHGRSAYLPLTRRIQRYMYLREIIGETTDDPGFGIAAAIQELIPQYNQQAETLNLSPLNIDQLADQIEPFLDDPDQATPLTLRDYFDAVSTDNVACLELGWKCFYLLSLLPRALRVASSDPIDLIALQEHLVMVQNEGVAAQKRLTEGTLRYVINVAHVYADRGIRYTDLVQEGFFGLVRATETFREYLGSHFQAHAATWIHQKIGRYIAEQGSMIRLPIHRPDELKLMRDFGVSFEAQYGSPPNEDDFLNQFSWLNDKASAEDEEIEDGETQNRTKVRKWLAYYHTAYSPHWSLEAWTLPASNDQKTGLESYLIDEDSLDQQMDRSSLAKVIDQIFISLNEREREILKLRFGMVDGYEYTLEEIGQNYGLTRERIRQIEANAMRKIMQQQSKFKLRDFQIADNHDSLSTVVNKSRQQLLAAIEDEQATVDHTYQSKREWEMIEALINRYIARARKGRNPTQPTGRAAILRQTLQAIGKPTYYGIVHDKALELTNGRLTFTKQEAYATMFYSSDFQSFGNGVFGLVEWETRTQHVNGEITLHHCPDPLLPAKPYPTAFFETIMVGREYLKEHPLATNSQFWHNMQRWAKQGEYSAQAIQAAFDAWYAAGLIARIDMTGDTHKTVQLTLSADADLQSAREHCLNALCRRVRKMPELLLTLDRVSHPTLDVIQKVLFGSEQDAFDVPTRLAMLVSLDAARRTDEEWYLSDFGRAALAINPPEELPDFELIDAVMEDQAQTSVDIDSEDWGLLDI